MSKKFWLIMAAILVISGVGYIWIYNQSIQQTFGTNGFAKCGFPDGKLLLVKKIFNLAKHSKCGKNEEVVRNEDGSPAITCNTNAECPTGLTCKFPQCVGCSDVGICRGESTDFQFYKTEDFGD